MTHHPNAPAFQDVADLIRGDKPSPWLATVLAETAGGVALSAREERDLLPAAEARDRLEQMKKASRVIARYLQDPHTIGRLDKVAPRRGDALKLLDSSGKLEWLADLTRRSSAAMAAVTAEDGEKAWPMPEGLTAAELCALVVARLWHAVRGTPAGPQSGKVRKACEAMWEACGQEPLGVDEGVWRRRLDMARKLLDDPALAAGMPANSPERQLHQRAVVFCDKQAKLLVELEQQQTRRERVAKVQERVEQMRAKR